MVNEPDQESIYSMDTKSLEGRSKPHKFSTISEAGRPVDGELDIGAITYKEILASGTNLPAIPGEILPTAIFFKRRALYKFYIHGGEPIRNLRLFLFRDIKGEDYNSVKLGESFPDKLQMESTLIVHKLGEKFTPGDAYYHASHELYIPQVTSSMRKVTVFIVAGEKDIVLVKARACFTDKIDAQRVTYLEAQMDERFDRMETLASDIHRESVWKIFNPDDIVTLIHYKKNIVNPAARFCMGSENTLLAFRVYEPPNRDYIVANVIFCAMDTSFVEGFAAWLSSKHPIRVVQMDMRGFGYSGGDRGMISSTEQAFRDIDQIMNIIKSRFPLPTILAGIHFTSGVLLNYANWPKRQKVDGFMFLTPVLGLDWDSRYGTESLALLQKDGSMKYFKNSIRIHRLSRGRIFGSETGLAMSISEDLEYLNPVVVNKMCNNYVRAYFVPFGRKAVKNLKEPMYFLLGDRDEVIQAKRLQDYLEGSLKNKNSRFDVLHDCTGLQCLMKSPDIFAKWILDLPSVAEKRMSLLEHGTEPYVTATDLLKVKPFMDASLYQCTKQCIDRGIYMNKSLCDRRFNLADVVYDIMEPKTLPYRPDGVLIFLAPRCFSNFLPHLVDKYRMFILRMDPYAFTKEGKLLIGCKHAHHLVNDAIALARSNFPASPIFLGGTGYGASIIINHESYADSETINGYIIIAPTADPDSPENVDLEVHVTGQYLEHPAVQVYFSQGQGSPNAAEKEILKKLSINLHDEEIKRINMPGNLTRSIRKMAAPKLVIIPEDYNIVDGKRVEKLLAPYLLPPFQKVEVPKGNVHQVLMECGETVGSWLSQLISSISPSRNFRLFRPKFEDFESINMIGKGAFSTVWLVRHKKSHRFLAMKILNRKKVAECKHEKQLQRESELLQECGSCPFVVSFIGAFDSRSTKIILMEFIVGGELFRRIREVTRMSPNEARFYMAEMCVVLEYLHGKNIVYRDLKPENIMIDAMGHIRLVDFGFAKKIPNPDMKSSFCGSPFYIAPEMLSSNYYGNSVDIWALGVLLYELLVGNPPFGGKTAHEVYRSILFGKLEIPSYIDEDSRDLIACLLESDRDCRLGHKNGIADVMAHRWFEGIDWEQVRNRQLIPPYKPQFSFEGDTVNFAQTIRGNPKPMDQLAKAKTKSKTSSTIEDAINGHVVGDKLQKIEEVSSR